MYLCGRNASTAASSRDIRPSCNRFGRGDAAAGATIDESAPRTRVQTIAVEIAGNAATSEALRGKVGVAGLRQLVER